MSALSLDNIRFQYQIYYAETKKDGKQSMVSQVAMHRINSYMTKRCLHNIIVSMIMHDIVIFDGTIKFCLDKTAIDKRSMLEGVVIINFHQFCNERSLIISSSS